MKLLHITAHLGGGVGRTISQQVAFSSRHYPALQRSLICLEKPEKTGAVKDLEKHNCELVFTPTLDELNKKIAAADVVQVEWWHHPVLSRWFYAHELPEMRLIVVSHVSGLHPPELPVPFVQLPHRFILTSPCSFEHPGLAELPPSERANIATIFSSGGFDDYPILPRTHSGPLRVGYVGTLNFAKLHPDFLAYLAAVDLPQFKVTLFGDPTTAKSLQQQAQARGLDTLLDFRGYSTDMASELARLDVLAYLLNPRHYGTTENALLEAMAMGVIPIALANPAERQLIAHQRTGFLVDSPEMFARTLDRLHNNPTERARISASAASETRERFAISRTATSLVNIYQEVIDIPKRKFDFRAIFGPRPSDWFLSCQGAEAYRFCPDGHVNLQGQPPHFIFEKTKSSATHFANIFPSDHLLQAWKKSILNIG